VIHLPAVPHTAALTIAGVTLALVSVAGVAAAFRRRRRRAVRRRLNAGVAAAIAAFVVCTSVSLNTGWRFTLDGLAMASTPERVLACAGYETLMMMSVLGARERLADDGTPGWFGSAVWALAGLAVVPAWHEGHGLTPGTIVRIIVGTVGSALAAHAALGLDLRHRTGRESQSWSAIVIRELRERAMARLGLAVRDRTAREIAADRALERAVRLADRQARGGRRPERTTARLAAALDAAGITDPQRKAEFLDRYALRRNAAALAQLNPPSPWTTGSAQPTDAERHVIDTAAGMGPVTAHLRRLLAERGIPEPGPIHELHSSHPLSPLPMEGEPGTRVDHALGLLHRTHGPVVYFIRNGSRVKIGTTTNLRGRIAALSLRPEDLVLVVHGDHKTELAYHRRFTRFRVRDTEWFEYAPELAAFIANSTDSTPAPQPEEPDEESSTADTSPDMSQVRAPAPPPTKSSLILAAAKELGDDATPADIALHLTRSGVPVDTAYVRTVCARAKNRPEEAAEPTPAEASS
jgi:hypothetical protein